ncbi:MAG: hypothetical protein AAF541_03205 [Pseudomonadota bacterium]
MKPVIEQNRLPSAYHFEMRATVGILCLLMGGLAFAQDARQKDARWDAEQGLSFFEYLAEMVETEEGWMDPLDMNGSYADMELKEVSEQNDVSEHNLDDSEVRQ